jgi:pimeloyl-ACP methyl ester carboxylesterase
MNRLGVVLLAAVAGVVAGMLLVGCGDEEGEEKVTPAPPTATVAPSGFFDSDGVKIHYETFGEGAPIVLVHGLFGSIQDDWVKTGLVDTLIGAGRRVIALDHRGHGESDKPHDPEDYRVEKMGQDVINMMDYLGIEKADIFGYSMGSFISSWVLINHQDRLNSVILGGTGGNLKPNDPAQAQAIYDALMAEDPSTITDPLMKALRNAFDQAGADRETREAMAACVIQFLPLTQHYEASDFADVRIPVMIINGEEDTTTAGVEDLAAAIPGAKLVTIPGAGTDHIGVRLTSRFKEEVLNFLVAQ